MGKHTLSLSLILFLIITAAASQVWQADAASISQIGSSDRIDGQVWEEILLSPERETTFYVSLTPEGEAAIEAQFRLEKMLALFQDAGNLGKYQVYYGRNIIEITGGAGILNFLEDWPELERVTAYTLEKDSELRTQAAYEPESYTGTSQITGQVTAGDGVTALSGIRVTAYKHISGIEWHKYPSVFTGGDGSYTITGLASGIFRVKFEDQFGDYVPEYFDNKFSFELATNFDLAEGETASNINAALALAGKISGTITLGGDGTESGLVASAWSSTSGSWKLISNALTNGSGAYTIGGLMPGNYRVMFSDSSTYVPPRYVTEYYDNKLEIENAQDLTVLAGGLTSGIDADLGPYGSVEGNVRAEDGVTNLTGIFVDVYRYDTANLSWDYFASVQTDGLGNYAVSGLGTEDIRVGFTDPYDQFSSEFYANKSDLPSADNVSVILGEATSNINAQLSLKNDTLSYDLDLGWNLISLPMDLVDNNLPEAFSSISGNYGDVWMFDSGFWQVFSPDSPPEFNDFSTVSTLEGYWINMTTPGSLSLTGTHPLETIIELDAGWNLIGYPSMSVEPVESALSSIEGKYTLVQQYKAADSSDHWKIYNPAAPKSLNDLKQLEPGFGYWIFMTQAATLIIQGR